MTPALPRLAAMVAVALSACSAPTGQQSAPCTPPPTGTPPTITSPLPAVETTPSTSIVDDGGRVVDPEAPLPVDVVADPPNGLGPIFATLDEPLPAQTTAALRAAGGEALAVNDALTSFGLFGVPRPSGTTSAVMEVTSTGTLLGDGATSSLSAEVVYMVSSTAPIEALLQSVAATITTTSAAPPSTIADYDGSTGDPRCARLPLEVGPVAEASVEGCEYLDDPLTDVRSVAVRRMSLPVTGALTLPAVFADVPAELVAGGIVESFTATFGRPTGPAGDTIQLDVRVDLTATMPALDGTWEPDGPNRWWNGAALITLDAGTATWTASTRAEPQ